MLVPSLRGPLHVKIINVGQSAIFLSPDKRALKFGSAGFPLGPNERWEDDYHEPSETVDLYAISAVPGGGMVDVAIISGVAGQTQGQPTFWQKVKSTLASPVSSLLKFAALFVALGCAPLAQAQTTTQLPPPLKTLSVGYNLLSSSALNAFTAYYWSWSTPSNETGETIVVTLANSGQVSPFFVDEIVPAPVSGGFISDASACLSSVDTSSFLTSIIVVNCPPSYTGARSMGLTLDTTATVVTVTDYVFTGGAPFSRLQPCSNFGSPGQAIYPENFVACNPSQLGLNNAVLPASSNLLSVLIDMRGVKQAFFAGLCGQPATVDVEVYDENASSSLFGVLPLGGTAANSTALHLGSESAAITSNGNTGGQWIQLPQRAMQFGFLNSTATPSTCSARLFLSY